MNKNILRNLNFFAPYPGSLIRSVSALDEKLKEKNIETIYLFPYQAKGLNWIKDMENSKGFKIFFKTGNHYKDIIIMNKIVRQHNIGIIHTHFWNLKDALIIKNLKIINPSLIEIIHHHSNYSASNSFLKEKIKKLLLSSNCHIGNSDYSYHKLIRLGFNKKNVIRIDNAVDFTRLDNYDTSCASWFDSNKKVFLMFSSFSHYIKGIDIALNAFKKIQKKNRNVVLAIVVSTNLNELEKYIRSFFEGIIPEWIILLPPRDDIATYYRLADCFISASREEGFCLSVVESIYAGTQTIQSRIGGHRLDIPNCKTFESEDVDGLIECITDVINEPKDVSEKNNALQKDYVVRVYKLDNWVDNVIDLYENLFNLKGANK